MGAHLTLIFGPLGLMLLYVLPKKQPAPGTGHAKHSQQDALYEVPKKKH